MIERINIKEIAPEILDETKASEEIKAKLKKIKDNNNEKKTLEENWWARNITKTKNKKIAEKLKKVNKIEGCEIRIKLIKDTTNSDTEELRIERVNKLIM